MLYNSYSFLFFLPVLLAIYYLTPHRHRNLVLAIASFVFYSFWDIRFISLLLLTIVVAFYCGNLIHDHENPFFRRKILIASLIFNLGILFVFKYVNFFIDSLQFFLPGLPHGFDIILPVGISFYTFQSMSYTLDIYFRRAVPVVTLVDFACYISMFPQLVAGPIVRFHEIETQLKERGISCEAFAHGIRRFIIGLSKKLLIADTMAPVADNLFMISNPGFGAAWLGALAFSLQIYFDFSGYSDMAIGLGQLFGFHLPENFRFPYQAISIGDFWRRWHMSLSYWLRDYLYIPLGGSRTTILKTIRNIFVTMGLCGLWHGASWTFFIWGGYFGLILVLERFFCSRLLNSMPDALRRIMTYGMVVCGWVLFRSENMIQALSWLSAMAGLGGGQSPAIWPSMRLMSGMLIIHLICWFWPEQGNILKKIPGMVVDMTLVMMFYACVIAIMGSRVSPFLYYQF